MQRNEDAQRVPTVGSTGLTRDYHRRPEIEAEIAALPLIDTEEYLSAVEEASTLEVIVHGIRQLLRSGDEDGAMQLASVLIQRSNGLIARAARSQFPGSSSADRGDVLQIVALQLWQEVFDTSPKEEFWEVNFTHMVFRACSDAADDLRRQRNRERPFRRSTQDDEPWDEEAEVPDDKPMDTDLFVSEALDQLEGDIQLAVYLHTQGFKAKSKNPAEPTISSILGVSDRTVRTYLRTGEEQLRQWLTSRAD